jgi:hypothetical protein
MEEVMRLSIDPNLRPEAPKEVPPSLCSAFDHPNKKASVAGYIQRFKQRS